MTTSTKMTAWKRERSVTTYADHHLSAYHLRKFVQALDAAAIPDDTLVTVSRSSDTMHATGLAARIEDTYFADTPPVGGDTE